MDDLYSSLYMDFLSLGLKLKRRGQYLWMAYISLHCVYRADVLLPGILPEFLLKYNTLKDK